MTAAIAPVADQVPAPPEIIEDRYRGLMWSTEVIEDRAGRHGTNSKLWDRLDRDLSDIVYGLFQHDLDANVDMIVEHLHDVIRETAVQFVVDDGSAEWDGRRPR